MEKAKPPDNISGDGRRTPSEQLRVRHGTLSDRTVCELLFFAYTTGMNGTLACNLGDTTKSLRFKSGFLIEAKSSDPLDSSYYILHEMGKFKDSQPASTDSVPDEKDQTLKMLSDRIQKGMMQPGEIDEFMHRRVRRILHDLMSWAEGDYVMEMSRVTRPDPPLKVHRSIPEMIMREIKVAPDPVGLRKILAQPDTSVEPVMGHDTKFTINLTAVEKRVLKSIRKPVSIRSATTAEGMGLEAFSRILLGLHALGMIRIRFDSVAPPQPPPGPTARKAPDTRSPEPEPVSDVLSEEDFKDMLESSGLDLDSDGPEIEKGILNQIIESGFQWDPYDVLDVDIHSSTEQINQAYYRKYNQINSYLSSPYAEIQEYAMSALNLLEESKTILTNMTLRNQFDSIRNTVDIRQKLQMANHEYRKGMQAYRTKRAPLAIVHLKFAIYLDDRNADYHHRLIYIMIQNQKQWKAARMLIDRCLTEFGTNPHIMALSGLLHHRRGSTAQARIDYGRALQMDPELAIARQGMEILNRPSKKR